MTDFRFAEPDRAIWLWAVAAVTAALFWFELHGSEILYRFLSPAMTARLAARPSLSKRILRVVYLMLSGTAVVVALMRPQWGISYERLPQVGAQIMICLDVSRSMLAEDVAPNRLERAKSEINDLLDLLNGDEVGLIAFAGKSTILSPMTTDFGFLKLILKEAGPASSGRGGTRLEDPIRKAVAGFGEAADLSRVVLLITDGDDLDSYPLAAAAEARDKGIRILTVGFGDEAGSRINVTDPRTGLKSMIRDANGDPVISRLNGELLREIAMTTEGAYIPAGTGSLDLVEIHKTHIAPLLRAETEGTLERVENEGFQWALLVAMLMLLFSLTATLRPSYQLAPAMTTLWVIAALATQPHPMHAGVPEPLAAETDDRESMNDSRGNEDIAEGDRAVALEEAGNPEPAADLAASAEPTLSPRERYNRGVGMMNADATEALEDFEQARTDAGADGELRFRAAFNLGWLAAQQADELIDSNPRDALKKLRVGIDWFQRAVRLRPKSEDARYNLEILMRRAVALADALAEREQGDLARRLDVLIQSQRETLREAADVLAAYADADRLDLDSEDARRAFRELAVKERQLLSDAEQVNEMITSRLAGVQPSPPASGTPPGAGQDMWQPAQLEAAQAYLTTATQRLGKARSQFKLREGQRGYRRAHLGLEALKSARDQLRDPGQRLKRLLSEARSLVQLTNRLAQSEAAGHQASVPVWLDATLLEGTQGALRERTEEIAAQLEVPETPPDDATGPLTAQDIANVRAAQQAIVRAAGSFGDAESQLHLGQPAEAVPYQAEAIRALNQAVERLIELRGLIERVYRDASGLDQTLSRWQELPEGVDQEALQQQLERLHARNMERAGRLREKIENELDKLTAEEPLGPEAPSGPPAPKSPEQTEQAQEQQRLELARELLDAAMTHMGALRESMPEAFAAPQPSDPSTTDSGDDPAVAEAESAEAAESAVEPPATESPPDEVEAKHEGETPSAMELAQRDAAAAVEQLSELRRLFYSIAEHLEETAQQQASVNDDTQALEGDPQLEPAQALGPLRQRQEEIRAKSDDIAEALQQLAQDAREQQQQQADTPGSPSSSAPQVEQYAKAGRLVEQGTEAMAKVDEAMAATAPELGNVRDAQDQALDKLLEALALLKPPQQQQNPDNQPQQQEPQEQEQQGQNQDQQQQQQQQGMSAQQLLQMVRDREAQRRKAKQQQAAAAQAPVEKDW